LKVKSIIQNHKKICWYPSAGADFRTLLFLSKQYCAKKNVNIDTNELPDLFVFTDCKPQDISFSSKNGYTEINKLNCSIANEIKFLYASYDCQTIIRVNKICNCDDLNIPSNDNLFYLTKSENYGKVFYMQVHISSQSLGEWDTDILYILIENTGFAFDFLIKNRVFVDYIVRVRYGDSFGGSALQGEWLLKLIKPLKVKYFLSNKVEEKSFKYIPSELSKIYQNYEYIWSNTDIIQLTEFYCVSEKSWSKQGDIHWYKT